MISFQICVLKENPPILTESLIGVRTYSIHTAYIHMHIHAYIKMRTILITATTAAILSGVPYYLIPESYGGKYQYGRNLLFFDGHCNLCNGFVDFLADRDDAKAITFGSIQRHTDFLKSVDAPYDLSTVVLVQNGHVYTHSAAALRTIALLNSPWNLLSCLYALPSPVRDLGYRFVATYRYAIFGRSETCRSPTEEFQSRFLDNENPQYFA